MKHYFIKYTIHDGECEYGDNGILTTDATDDDKISNEFISSFWNDASWNEEINRYELEGDYRQLQVDSIVEVPEEDYNVLHRYI